MVRIAKCQTEDVISRIFFEQTVFTKEKRFVNTGINIKKTQLLLRVALNHGIFGTQGMANGMDILEEKRKKHYI